MKSAAILIVDDEPSMLEIFEHWLAGAGYTQVRSARDGQEALAMCCVEKFDLVISDINMPLMDGMSFLRKLRDLGQRMPAIVFVNGPNPAIRKELLSLGASAFLQKPFRLIDLMTAIERALKGWQSGVEGSSVAA